MSKWFRYGNRKGPQMFNAMNLNWRAYAALGDSLDDILRRRGKAPVSSLVRSEGSDLVAVHGPKRPLKARLIERKGRVYVRALGLVREVVGVAA